MYSDVHLHLDKISVLPSDTAEVGVRGWCWSPRTRIAALSLECEGRRAPCLIGLPRPDVAAHLRDQRAADAGFFGRIRVPGPSDRLQLVATIDGNPELLADLDLPQPELGSVPGGLAAREPQCVRENDEGLHDRPLLSLILSASETPAFYLHRSIESVLRQGYPFWQLAVVADPSSDPQTPRYLEEYSRADERVHVEFQCPAAGASVALNRALSAAHGKFVIQIDPGDELHSSALLEVAACLNQHPEAALIYSDADRIDDEGQRFNPLFKPAFDPDVLLAFNYMGHFVAIRKDLIDRLRGFRIPCDGAQDWDLLIRAVEITDASSIRHLTKPLYHSRDLKAPKPAGAQRKILEDHAVRTNQAASVHTGLFPGSMRVKLEPARQGRIAVIVRSADGIHQHHAIRRAREEDLTLYEVVQGVLRRAGVMDSPACTLNELDEDVVVFVNGPVNYFNHAFLKELQVCAERQDCGIAGPLVLDREGNIISAGAMCTSDGGTRDLFRGLPFSTTAYMGLARVTRSVASLSSRCFAVSKSRLRGVGGLASLQEDGITELCERLVKAAHADGLKVLYTPYAVVSSAESDTAPREGVCVSPRAPRLNPNLEINPNFETNPDREATAASAPLDTELPLLDRENQANPETSTFLSGRVAGALDFGHALLTGAMRLGRDIPVSVIIPKSGEPDQMRRCLASLQNCLPRGCEVQVVEGDEKGLASIENCNRAIETILPSGRDVLLLHPGGEVTSGFLSEMYYALHSHERHAVVSPRSNNAGIFSIPVNASFERGESFSLWKQIKGHLPRFQTVPTCDGFCVLLRNSALRAFGLFDPVYEQGYDAEHDFVCRINRVGYSAVAANRAFVFHDESPLADAAIRRRNRLTLEGRYPEYPRKISQYLRYYLHTVERFSARFRPGRQRILFDLTHLPAKYCGTSELALNLLMRLAPMLESKYDLYLHLSLEASKFFAPELTGYRILDSLEDMEVFDLVYKPAQIFSWGEWYRMVRHGARLAYTHLDVIAIRCEYLSGPNTRSLFRTAAELVDLGITISEFSKRDFERLYGIDSRFLVIHPGVHESEVSHNPGDFILIVGNSYPHKATDLATEALRGLDRIVVLGGDPRDSDDDAGIRRFPSGSQSPRQLTELYDAAKVVVFPSYYEGFGLPILEALAQGKPVVAQDTEVVRELAGLARSPRLRLAADFVEMRQFVSALLAEPFAAPPRANLRSWRDVARDYAAAFEALLNSPIDVGLLERRWKLTETLDAYHSF